MSHAAQPPYLFPEYRSTVLRAPSRPLVPLKYEIADMAGPIFGPEAIGPADADLTRQHAGPPLGERIIVSGQVFDATGAPLAGTLVEVWQANSAGRYAHPGDQHDAPLDPNFSGGGRSLTDAEGSYRFVTVKPGAYPWQNHENAWRPAHIHFSVFGRTFADRLVTQMYFPGDPLLPHDPILRSVPAPEARERLVAAFDWRLTEAGRALGYRFDLVLGGPDGTPAEG